MLFFGRRKVCLTDHNVKKSVCHHCAFCNSDWSLHWNRRRLLLQAFKNLFWVLMLKDVLQLNGLKRKSKKKKKAQYVWASLLPLKMSTKSFEWSICLRDEFYWSSTQWYNRDKWEICRDTHLERQGRIMTTCGPLLLTRMEMQCIFLAVRLSDPLN